MIGVFPSLCTVVMQIFNASMTWLRIAKVYNDAAEKSGKVGRIHGIEGDIRTKVSGIPIQLCRLYRTETRRRKRSD